MGLEYAIELIPCYKDGLWHLVKRFGVDRMPGTREAYCEAYLNAGVSKTVACPRKRDGLPDESYARLLEEDANDEGPAFINVWPRFVHCSLMFVNPPSTMDDAAATQCIRKSIHLEKLVNVEHPRLTFSGKVRTGNSQGRKVWQIDSNPSDWVRNFRMKLQEVFARLGFCCRFPHEAVDRVHCTIRDSRYAEYSLIKVPSDQGTLEAVFDKLAVTPAAENDARHECKRQFCGKTHCLNFFVSRQVKKSGGDSSSVSLFDLASFKEFPELSVPKKPSVTPNHCWGHVIQPVLHLDPAADIIVPFHNSTQDNVRSLPREDVAMSSNEARDDTASVHTEGPLPQEQDVSFEEKVYCLHFSMQGMKPKDFQAVLSQSEELQKVREDMERVGCDWLLQPSEAKMFVHPTQCNSVKTTLRNPVNGIVLHPFHVIITESFEDHLRKALQAIPSYKSRPRSKPNKCRDITPLMKFEKLDYSSEWCVQRTFICEAPVLCKKSAVTQSTTEATTLNATNPRRIQCEP